MQINAYLQFNGQCEAAFKFYAQCLGGKVLLLMTYGEAPMAEKIPPDWRGKIMHARLDVQGQVVMGSDVAPDRFEAPKGCSMSIGVDDPAEAERVFAALAEKGTVGMPLQPTFWAERFGVVVDRFGIPWMVNCERPGPTK
jgi:PhnB protein